MCYKVPYFVKTHNIPAALVANNGQIGMHLVPKIGECTWKVRVLNTHQVMSDGGQETGDTRCFIICRWVVVPPSSCI